jgi:hypothetical protein
VNEGRDERISDDLGRGKSNACVHRKRHYWVNPDRTSVSYGSNSGGPCVQTYSAPHSWYDGDLQYVRSLLNWDVSVNTGLPPRWAIGVSPDESSAQNILLQRASQLKADVLLNVVEANQIWPSIQTLAKSLPNMAYNWSQLRKVLKTASASFLAWKFGVSPILSDIMKVQRSLPKLKDDIQRHADGEKTRFSLVLPVTLVHSSGAYASGSLNGFPSYKFSAQGRQLSQAQIRYVLVVRPKAQYMTSFFQKADYAMSRFGSSAASLAWELVPFSFVADWFVDLRGAVNKVDSLLGTSPYEIVSFTRSFGYEVAEDHFLDSWSPCDGSIIDSFSSATVQCSHYERSNVSGGNSISWKPRFGKNQAAISAALITQGLLKIPGAMRF